MARFCYSAIASVHLTFRGPRRLPKPLPSVPYRSQWEGEMPFKSTIWTLLMLLPLASSWLELGHLPHLPARNLANVIFSRAPMYSAKNSTL